MSAPGVCGLCDGFRTVLNRRCGVVSAPGVLRFVRLLFARGIVGIALYLGEYERFDVAYTCIFVVELCYINKIREIYFIWFHCVGS